MNHFPSLNHLLKTPPALKLIFDCLVPSQFNSSIRVKDQCAMKDEGFPLVLFSW